MYSGKYFVLEGGEATGKTLQILKLCERLKGRGIRTLATREPGNSKVGEVVRAILLDKQYAEIMSKFTNLLLFNACRHQNVCEFLTVALESGTVVISDRSYISTLVYQSHVEGLDRGFVEELCRRAMTGIVPTKVFVIDISIEEIMRRLSRDSQNKQTKYDLEGMEFHEKVREGYLLEAQLQPDLIEVIDGSQTIEAINDILFEKIVSYLQ